MTSPVYTPRNIQRLLFWLTQSYHPPYLSSGIHDSRLLTLLLEAPNL